MPDVLIRDTKEDEIYWVEVKRHHNDSGKIVINAKNFDDYLTFYTDYTERKLFVYCINPVGNNLVDIYYASITSFTKEKAIEFTDNNGKRKYMWRLSNTMKKLNTKPVTFSDYME